MDIALTGTAWTLRQPERRGHCVNRNGVVTAATGTAWTLRQPEQRGYCFNRNGVDTASTGTAWTLRLICLFFKCHIFQLQTVFVWRSDLPPSALKFQE